MIIYFLLTGKSTKGKVISLYERDEMKPSIEGAANMAKILEVYLDWPVGNTDTELNTNTLNRIQDIDKLNEKDKDLVFSSSSHLSPIVKLKKHLTKIQKPHEGLCCYLHELKCIHEIVK